MSVTPFPSRAVDASSGVLDVDLDRPLPSVRGGCAHEARVLLRRGDVPVGVVDVPVPATGLTAAELAEAVATVDEAPVGPDRSLAAADIRADDLAVVIATRDRAAALERALDSLLASAAAPAQVVVVDNAPSDDDTRSLVTARAADEPRLTYVREATPGLACAHNAALPHLTAPYVAFTDDDVVVDPWWTARLAATFRADPRVACVTGLIVPAELCTPEQWWIERAAGFGKGFARRLVDPAVEADADPLFPYAAGGYGSGANMAFRTDVLLGLGGFDPALGAGTEALGGDDLAAIHAVLAAGHRLVYEPAAVVFHHHHRTYEALRRQVYGYGAGLTAYLTSLVVARPSVGVTLARRALAGARHALAPSSDRNARRPRSHRELARVERWGMASGPWRYLRAHRARRRLRPDTATSPPVAPAAP